MIYDKLENSALYVNAHPLFKIAFDFIEDYLKSPKENGKYFLDGDKIYAVVQDSVTKEMGKYESHKKYIDLQFVVSGEEKILCNFAENLAVKEEYNKEKDVSFYEGNDFYSELILDGNTFAILYPADVHMPCVSTGEIITNKKIVVKIAV